MSEHVEGSELTEAVAKAIYAHSETNEAGDTCLCGEVTGHDLAKHQAAVVMSVLGRVWAPVEFDRDPLTRVLASSLTKARGKTWTHNSPTIGAIADSILAKGFRQVPVSDDAASGEQAS